MNKNIVSNEEGEFYLLKCNFHTHFAETYGNGAKVMVDAYYKAGYHCIALTEHDDCIKDLQPEKEAQAYAKKKYGSDFLVIVGEEVAFDDSENTGEPSRELLALFIDSYIDCGRDSGVDYSVASTPAITLNPLLQEIHKQGGIAIVCHDNWLRWLYNCHLPAQKEKIKVKKFEDYKNGARSAKWFWDYRKGKEIDGWEVGNGGGLYREHLDGVSYMLSHPRESVDENYIVLSNSDAHCVNYHGEPDTFRLLNRCHTYVFAKDRSVEGIKEALLQRRTVACCDGTLYGKAKWLELEKR